MRSVEEVALVLHLIGEGFNDCEISRRTGIPRTTVRDWRAGRRTLARPDLVSCPGCGHPAHDYAGLHSQYSYLLGLYLGDGCIATFRRGVFRLAITLDRRYPGIIRECSEAMHAVSGKVPYHAPKPGCVDVATYWKSWPCLLPQHGPRKKHERPIVLADWQQRIVDRHPGALLRGLIHSDGWRGMNRVRVRGKTYAYPRYNFSNRSEDILRIFCDACDAVGVRWRRMNAVNISVARRDAVARLDELVGPKR